MLSKVFIYFSIFIFLLYLQFVVGYSTISAFFLVIMSYILYNILKKEYFK